MNLDQLAKTLHQTAKSKGFWDPISRIPEEDHFVFYAKQLAMIHSEATEVLEALRKSKGQEAVVEELADIIIRVLDLWAGMEDNKVVSDSLHDALMNKAQFNESRQRMHGVAG